MNRFNGLIVSVIEADGSDLEQQLRDITQAIDNKEYQTALEKAKSLQSTLQSSSLGNKESLLANLYHIMGNIYMKIEDYSQATDYYKKGKLDFIKVIF